MPSRALVSLSLLFAVGAGAVPLRPGSSKRTPVVKGPPSAPRLPAPPQGSVTPEAESLGRGIRLLWSGDLVAAERELRPLVEVAGKLRNPDYALWGLAQAELLDGQPEAALVHFEKLSHMKSRFAPAAIGREADAARLLGRADVARKLYETVITRPVPEIDLAACRFHIAELEPGKAKAALLFRKVYLEHPLHPLAQVALDRMGALDPATTITVPERIHRAKIMSNNRGWQQALEELKLLPAELPQAQRDDADYWYATTLFHMRREYDVAAQKLLGLWMRLPTDEQKAEALFHGSRALSRADHDAEAIVGYRELVAKFPRCKNASEASFLAGWLEFNRGHYKDAISALEDTLRRYGQTTFADDARWYLGFSRWLDGDVTGALADFTTLSEGRGDLSAGKGGYFRALALDRLGRTKEALDAWHKLARERPFTHYALLSRLRLAEKSQPVDVFGRTGEVSTESLPELSHDPDRQVVRDPAVARVDELLAAGLPVEASFELQKVENDLVRRYTAARALPVLFDRYLRGQDFYRIHRLAEAHAGHALALDPYVVEAARSWWELVYPRAYRAFVEKYSPSGKNPPEYLYTIMQKESAYNPHDVSYADAIGLLQMIPPTSKKVAEHVGLPYTDDVLYDPEGNIRFGAWYIGHLLQKFKGQLAIGAGSYNAGPKAMEKWLSKYGDRPLDEFIELCPYTQTREYMKKALAIYTRYVWLYDHKDYLPSLKVDADWVKDDGIEY
ncbi:MAG: transglycosylase SLT domain-containing protein [Polyangia bacterium]